MPHRKPAFVIPSFTWGGAELQMIRKLNVLQENGFDPHLVILGTQLDLIQNLTVEPGKILLLNADSHNFLNKKAILQTIPTALSILNFLRKKKITVLVGVLPLSHWVCRWIVILGWFRFYRIRVLQYHHSEQFSASPGNTIEKKIFHRVNSLLALICDHSNIFISNAVRADMRRGQFIRRPIVIYNFVDEKIIEGNLAMEYLKNLNKNFKKVLVIPGRLHKVKGQLLFLDAVKNLLTPGRMAEEQMILILAGGGDEKEALEKKINEMEIEPFVVITGFIENDLLLSFLKLSELVIIPSLNEGLGNVAIESIMLECNVLCSNAGGLKEVIGECNCGVMFESGNASELQARFSDYLAGRLVFNPKAGYEWYKSHFTTAIQSQRLMDLFYSLEK